jgi:hypothetical protein
MASINLFVFMSAVDTVQQGLPVKGSLYSITGPSQASAQISQRGLTEARQHQAGQYSCAIEAQLYSCYNTSCASTQAVPQHKLIGTTLSLYAIPAALDSCGTETAQTLPLGARSANFPTLVITRQQTRRHHAEREACNHMVSMHAGAASIGCAPEQGGTNSWSACRDTAKTLVSLSAPLVSGQHR